MQLISLKLLGYRRFLKQEIYFSSGTTLIFGRNGSGKSSLFDAIGYAFFGWGNRDFLRTTIAQQHSYFLGSEYPSKIELSFLYGSGTYTITRVINAGHKKHADDFIPTNKDMLLWPDWVHIIGGTEVTNYIENLLGLSRETFLRSVFTRQKDIETLSGKTLSERKELIHKIVWIDAVEEKMHNIQKEYKQLTDEKRLYQKRIDAFDISTHENNKKEYIQTQKDLQKELDILQKEYETIKKSNKKLAQEWKTWQIKFTEFSRLQTEQKVNESQQEAIKKRLEDIEKQLSDIQEAQRMQEEKHDLPQKKELADTKNIAFERQKVQFSQKEKLQHDLKTAQENMILCTKDIDILEQKLAAFSSDTFQKKQISATKKAEEYLVQISQLTLESDQLTQAGKKLKEEYDAFVALGEDSECPTCKRPLQEQFPIVLEMFESQLKEKRSLLIEKTKEKQHIQNLQKENADLLAYLQSQDEEYKTLQKKRDELYYNQKNFREKLTQLQEDLNKLSDVVYDREIHENFKKEYQTLLQDWEQYQKRAVHIEKKEDLEKDYADTLHQQENILQVYALWEASLQKLQFDAELYASISQSYEQVSQNIERIQEQIDAKKDEKAHIDAALANLTHEYGLFQKEREYMQQIHQKLLEISQTQECLRAYIEYLLHALKPHIESVASEYFSLMTDGLYSQISLDEDYHMCIDGKTIDMYSGWEKDLAYLCFRLSLGQNLSVKKGNHINFLVLDEVLGSQDVQRQYNIFIALSNLKHKFSQILLISHHEDMKDLAVNLIEIKKIDEKRSEIVVK